jgi:uncharacterized caspase-like protein/peptidoglycan hydrolase-like protein with peptidoglycan-binding domain
MSQAFHSRALRAIVSVFLAALIASFAHAPAAAAEGAEKRVALVIGNGHYKAAPQLDNPSGDAGAIAASLRRLGFQVIEGHDLTIAQMRQSVADFSAALTDAKAAVVYYAGHGVSVDEENYLLPTDIVLKSATDLDLNAIGISLLLKQMKREDRINVVILDACRDNPFAAELARSASRSAVGERGLSRVEGDLARGTLIAFASDPKSVALDGLPGQHSPFTKALIDHIEDAGVPIDTVMNRVRSEVWEATRNKQLPWVNTSIIGEFSLNPQAPASPPSGAAASAAPADKLNQENLLWESAQHSNLAADYQAYLDSYPNGAFARMARNRIASANRLASLGDAPEVAAAPVAPAVSRDSTADFKAEISNEETEKSLNLSAADRKELQRRLAALAFDAGPANGAFGDKTRLALVDWQKKRGATPTGWLGPLQLAALKAESEIAYRSLSRAPEKTRVRPVVVAPNPVVVAPNRVVRTVRRTPIHRFERIEQPGQEEAPRVTTGAVFGGGGAPSANVDPLRPCQPGAHSESFPSPSGYRCVLNR